MSTNTKISRRGLLIGGLGALATSAFAGGVAYTQLSRGENERLAYLFEGFDELLPDDARQSLQPFGRGDYPVAYFGTAREVYNDCSADIMMWEDAMLNGPLDRRFIPILVMPERHASDEDSVFLDQFREMQQQVPEARVLTHDDPNFVKAFGIRNGGPYRMGADGYVTGHSRNLHIYNPAAEQILFRGYGDDAERLNAGSFRMDIITGRFEQHIHPTARHVDRRVSEHFGGRGQEPQVLGL